MNKLILMFALVLCGSATFAQTTLYQAKLKKEVIPVVILQSISEDFPEATVTEYGAIPVDVIDGQVFMNGKLKDDMTDETYYDTYVVALTGKNGDFKATYDRDGNLISTSEYLKNIPLPRPVMAAMGRHFPGWGAVGDKMAMTSIKNGQQKTHYKVTLQKGKDIHHVIFDADGNIIRGAEKALPHRQIKFREHEEKMEKEG